MIRNERIQATLNTIAGFGAVPEGGTTRLSYSKEFLGSSGVFASGNAQPWYGGCS